MKGITGIVSSTIMGHRYLDFEVDFDAQTIHVWFQDRYEWHQYYPTLYTPMPSNYPWGGARAGSRREHEIHAPIPDPPRPPATP